MYGTLIVNALGVVFGLATIIFYIPDYLAMLEEFGGAIPFGTKLFIEGVPSWFHIVVCIGLLSTVIIRKQLRGSKRLLALSILLLFLHIGTVAFLTGLPMQQANDFTREG